MAYTFGRGQALRVALSLGLFLAKFRERSFSSTELLLAHEEATKDTACHHIALACHSGLPDQKRVSLMEISADYVAHQLVENVSTSGSKNAILQADDYSGLHPKCVYGATI